MPRAISDQIRSHYRLSVVGTSEMGTINIPPIPTLEQMGFPDIFTDLLQKKFKFKNITGFQM